MEERKMTLQDKLNKLEEIMELDENSLKPEMKLDEIEEWDSMSKLYLVSYVKKNYKKRLTIEEIKNFITVQDICDYLE